MSGADVGTPFTHDGAGTSADAWADAAGWADVPELTLDGFDRVVVVAAHPDDETLGAGGLMASASARGLDVQLVVCTAGEASHPGSRTHAPDVLATRRRTELRAAYAELAPGGGLTMVDLGDGRVADNEVTVVDLLVDVVRDGRATLLVAPWRHDGHPDHDATGRAAATAALRTGATLWEYPIWFWHWAEPSTAPWADLRRLPLLPPSVDARSRAMACHRSQTEPLSDGPGDEALLQPRFLAHFTGPTDRFVVQPAVDDALERLHREVPDPWGVDERWYERRKRAITLALLPRERFARGLEVGCSIGALTAELGDRCDQLVAVDASPTAVAAAQARQTRTASGRDVEVRTTSVPAEWPEGRFDLVVVSEVGYFLSPVELEDLVARVRASLTPDGAVVLCHWRHHVRGWPLTAEAVHTAFVASGLRPVQARHVEADFEALLLCADTARAGVDR